MPDRLAGVGHELDDSDTNVIEVAMRRLRMKIDEGQPLKLIQTVRGMGYVLDVPEEE